MPKLGRPTPATVENRTNTHSGRRATPLVPRLPTTPVKGTALHHPRALTLTENGVPESRRFQLVDARRRLFNGKQHGPLVRLTAELDPDGSRLSRGRGRPRSATSWGKRPTWWRSTGPGNAVDVHEEDTWAGRRLRIDGTTVQVVGPVPRCVVTHENPESGEVDFGTLKTIVRYRGELPTDLSTPVAHLPDNGAVILGMCATVELPGEIFLRDQVDLLDEAAAQPA